ncbi:putative wall-associated receptor kinase-like protein 16 [Cinnamomum micranthum f. kanehirae]|uniref:Putative wall-associated receptor kinase-like protein 16 n=1 Tax=Cinnamomum micranthum f. kanehirae TaxID=337451 RepID=A0A443NSG2_9MAGN|nr:putative wall-associated receptor kinase-like protein 16 [Cinnamomum micranthum f. kanehirae]
MLSQINHRNVLRILGGCFETATPMPVFEFVCNESLYHLIHEKDLSSRISWDNRPRIATEVADALAYLHTGTSKPIVHQDIKSAKNLLDEHCTANVIGFEQSILIPLGKSTVGSVDPYYHSTGQVTEKCDVCSYGVLLLEILTGRKTFEWSETGEGAGFVLVDFAISSMKGNRLHLIFEPCKLKERNREQLMACAELAMKCIIKWKPDERPTMTEAAQELRQIKDIL